ncbi:MAG: 3-isopropylmalate dehydratase small subunit [Chromatiales bacterium]|jgi:3-isopropylmalate/(R)-2-methylmalate dehydratase small subunit|nr:3-isopropylmalate dehydratase small subunit [Chromatiales bacterium]
MEQFTTFKSIGVPIDIPNCDTDQIVPARFLRNLPEDEGYDRYLFHDLRYNDNGAEREEFIYNREPYRHGKIFVADLNWGCGSSRENAVDVLVANGVRCVIAPSFGDIHYSNCMKHGVLPVELPRDVCDALRAALHDQPGAEISVDLKAQSVIIPGGSEMAFEIAEFDKYRMLNGLDEIGLTREYDAQFEAFEERHARSYDWL